MRQSEFSNLHPQFLDRWSPRSFHSEKIPKQILLSLFEAARWAPSCFNEQPWRFVYAQDEQSHSRFLALLTDSNQIWGKSAPILAAVFAKKTFAKNGKRNRWAEFDTGAAWMALNLQALSVGLYCHGMAGYDEDRTYEVCDVDPAKYQSICMVAIGKKDSKDKLPENLKDREFPSERQPLEQIVAEGKMTTRQKE